ncbi:hypothetical protein SAMN02745121_04297 [Nannocystis exedens]|uniref:Uncharacterized protein n=1 Tax=Nannocystis exedens TaxID=54 RepID=A0A1I2APJ8_9BACT|nr:hypothetical protein NAEX_07283 [Nannocystis exedens]SFE45832.1 hypothetical protein SAMN02745121_04297 [Nannocystis exedens]
MAVPPSLTPCSDRELAVIEEKRAHIRLVFEERKDLIVPPRLVPRGLPVTGAFTLLTYFA